MDDVPEGGGAPTTTVIADAVSNAVFNDISELDRAGGRVSLRKVFVGVQTNNRDGYFGANVIVADPPDDPNVSVTIFSTRDVFDRRADASSRVEAYLNSGPEWPGLLYENHIEGQRSIQILSRTNAAPPPVGRTLVLRVNEALSNQYEQYVRITRVVSEERTFTDDRGDFQAQVVTCDISDELRADFPGTAANRFFSRASNATKVRDTVVADAGSYHGTSPLTVAAANADSVVTVGSIYSQLVPNARTETSLVDQYPSRVYQYVLASSPREVLVGGAPLSQRIKIGQENRGFNFPTILTPLPAPGSVRVSYRALGNTYTITDNGDGTMSGSGTGTVNYLTGSVNVTLQALPDDRSAVVFYWGENRSYTNRAGQAGFRPPEFSFYLDHAGVTPGSVSFTWTSGSVVKTATANANGVISGDAVGEVVHITGAVWFRPTAMLDADSEISIDYTWSNVVEETKPGLTPDVAGMVSFTLTDTPVPGSIELIWFTARETSITSGATSSYGSSTKSSENKTSVTAKPDGPPRYTGVDDIWAAVGYAYQNGDQTLLTGIGSGFGSSFWRGGSTTSGTGSVVTTSQKSSSDSSSYTQACSQTSKTKVTVVHTLTDNGSGGFINSMGTVVYASKTLSVKVVGNYSETSYQNNYEKASAWESLNSTGTDGGGGPAPSSTEGGGGSNTSSGGEYGTHVQSESYGSAALFVRYKTGSASPTAHTQTYTPPATIIDLCPYTKDMIVPGSVRFTWMGTVYDEFEGKIYRGRTDTDPGVHCGGISYGTGLVTLFDYVVGGPATAFTLNSMWTTKRRTAISNVTFNTPSAPVKPTGIVISVQDVDGTQIIATGELDGDIAGPHTRGKIDYESGLVEIQFGDYVLDSSLTAAQKAEWWYSPDNIRSSDGKIWRPWPVDPETLRYNAVTYFYLPLDADILGLDPVRLPQDGRVPIFRPGGFIVVGHTGTVGPNTVSNGQTINCGRVRLSRVRVIGADGGVINTGYSANLDAGIVTFSNVSGYSQPVSVEHRIEDMAMVAEVQIDGRVRLTRQLSHAYPVPGSYVSSALVAGDLRSRVSLVFDQHTWTNAWSDVLIGSAATGTYNDIGNPITVTNSGALTERWAVIFTSNTAFQVIGEHVGGIATGSINEDCSPLNPASGTPYFTIPAAGWGSNWSNGNVLRFNTVGAYFPVWVVRTIQQGPETVPDDKFALLIRGDVDA
jgi:hypothetical protein